MRRLVSRWAVDGSADLHTLRHTCVIHSYNFVLAAVRCQTHVSWHTGISKLTSSWELAIGTLPLGSRSVWLCVPQAPTCVDSDRGNSQAGVPLGW